MALGETAQLAVQLDLKGNLTSGLSGASRALSNLDTQVGKTGQKIGRDLSAGLGKTVQTIEKMGLVVAGFAVGAGVAAVKWAGDFQAQLNTINTIAFATPEALSKIGDSIRDIAKKTGISTDELTGAYYDLLSAGIKTADAQAVLNDAVTLGIGGLATTKETVDLLTTAYNAYGLTAAGAATATDEFAQAVADGKVTASEIASTFANVASLAKTAGVGIDQIAASFAFLTAQGVPASEVTTEMQRAIISLMKPLPALAKAQKELKINFAADVTKEGLVPALQKLREYADKTGTPLIDLVGRVEAVKYILQTTGPNAAGFAAELDKITGSSGMAAKQMAEREQGLNFQLSVLKANVKDAGITIGTALLPQLASLAGEAAKFLQGHQAEVKQFASDLARGFRDAVTWARSLDWDGIAQAVKDIAGFGKSLADGFLGLPTEAKEILLGLFALNKVSGGAVIKIGVDIAGGLFGQFAARGSSPANPMFVAGIEGGIGGGGGLGGALKLLPWIAFGALIAEGFIEGNKAHPENYGTGVAPGSPAPKPFAYGPRSALVDPNNVRYQGNTPANMPPQFTAAATQAALIQFRADERASATADKIYNAWIAGARLINKTPDWLTTLTDRWRKAGQTMHDKIAEAIKGLSGPHAGSAAAFLGANLGSHGFGAGGITQATSVLAMLHQLQQTPEVVKAIRELEAKLPRLRTDAKDLAAAEKIAQGTDPKNKKLDELNRIMADLRAHGDKTTRAKVQDLIEAVKHNKIDVHVTIPISVADINGKLKIRQTYKSGYNYIS